MVKLLYVHIQQDTQQKKGTDSKTWTDSKQSLLREKGSDSDHRTIPISSHHMTLAGKVNLGFFFKRKPIFAYTQKEDESFHFQEAGADISVPPSCWASLWSLGIIM